MKLRNNSGHIEQVKIRKCDDCGRWVVDIDNEELDALELIANKYKIVQLDLQEMNDYNEFLQIASEMIQMCWEYYLGRMDEREEGKHDNPGPEKN
jgi:hypothetical protein